MNVKILHYHISLHLLLFESLNFTAVKVVALVSLDILNMLSYDLKKHIARLNS